MAGALALNGPGTGHSDLVDRVKSVNLNGSRNNELIGKLKNMFSGVYDLLSTDSSINMARPGYLREALLAPHFLSPYYFALPETRVNSASPGNQERERVVARLLALLTVKLQMNWCFKMVGALALNGQGTGHSDLVDRVKSVNLNGSRNNELIGKLKNMFRGVYDLLSADSSVNIARPGHLREALLAPHFCPLIISHFQKLEFCISGKSGWWLAYWHC